MRRLVSWSSLLTLTLSPLAALPGTANAMVTPVSALASSSWQTDGAVLAMTQGNGTVYLGGDFTAIRPPGTAKGDPASIAASHLAAIDAATGNPAAVTLPAVSGGTVKTLALSPDGRTLYLGGTFTQVGGVYRSRIAAIDLATGALTRWFPKPNGPVKAIAVSASTVYFGGGFALVDKQPRARLAAAGVNGQLLPWAPTVDKDVEALQLTPDDTGVVIGGSFDQLNGAAQHAIGAVDASSGASRKWATTPPACSVVKDIITDGARIYVSAEGTGLGCYDGTFSANPADGSLYWMNKCLGATQSIAIVGGYLFTGSHGHDCSAMPGGYPQISKPAQSHHLSAISLADGLLAPWYPLTSGQPLGPRALASDGTRLFVGGDFGTVNNQKQQGFAIFPGGPDTSRPNQPAPPTVVSPAAGVLSVTWSAVTDKDDGALDYAVYRDGATTPACQVSASAYPNTRQWSLPVLRCRDSGLAPGSSHTYRVQASDGTNTSVLSRASAPVIVSGTNPPQPYDAAVRGSYPAFYWRLGETTRPTAADSSGRGLTGTYVGGVTPAAGAIAGSPDGASAFDGSSGIVTMNTPVAPANTFTIEAWFKTTSTTGGKIVGFGNAQTGFSSLYDRHIFLNTSGQVLFGVYNNRTYTVRSPNAYNDGQWHYVVASLGSTGMALYLDGRLVGTNTNKVAQQYDGYWRVGGDNLTGWGAGSVYAPAPFFAGDVDEVAVYGSVLPAATVLSHYNANVNH